MISENGKQTLAAAGDERQLIIRSRRLCHQVFGDDHVTSNTATSSTEVEYCNHYEN